jgi:hypothetical protein
VWSLALCTSRWAVSSPIQFKQPSCICHEKYQLLTSFTDQLF